MTIIAGLLLFPSHLFAQESIVNQEYIKLGATKAEFESWAASAQLAGKGNFFNYKDTTEYARYYNFVVDHHGANYYRSYFKNGRVVHIEIDLPQVQFAYFEKKLPGYTFEKETKPMAGKTIHWYKNDLHLLGVVKLKSKYYILIQPQ